MGTLRFKLPNGGFITYLNSCWYEVYQLDIDENNYEMDLIDEWGYPRGTIKYENASEILLNHYVGEEVIEHETIVIVKNGKLLIKED